MFAPPRLARLALLVASMGILVAAAPTARAQELVTPKVKDRQFPGGLFCPLPFDMTFTADGPNATLRFSGNVFFAGSGGTTWAQQMIDNVCVAPLAVYNANQVAPGSNSSFCYIGNTIPTRFAFQSAGTLPLAETFSADPSLHWEMNHGAYWDQTRTAPNDPGVETSFSPLGCLGLGQDSATPSLSDSAWTGVTVDGLTSGQSYVMSGWWYCAGDMELGKIFLTARVYGAGVSPIATRTWGALKQRYH